MNHISTVPSGLESGLGLFTYGDIPTLTRLASDITQTLGGLDIESCSTLEEISYPNLTAIDPSNAQGGYVYITGCAALTTVYFPQLRTALHITFSACPLLAPGYLCTSFVSCWAMYCAIRDLSNGL